MIEQLGELARLASVERMNISIQCQGNDHVSVAIQAVLKAEPDNASIEQKQLRSALGEVICISGYVGEVDAKLVSLLSSHLKAKPAFETLITNVEQIADKIKSASSSVLVENASTKSTEESSATSVECDEFTNGDADSL